MRQLNAAWLLCVAIPRLWLSENLSIPDWKIIQWDFTAYLRMVVQ
jgi:hypothetical protein